MLGSGWKPERTGLRKRTGQAISRTVRDVKPMHQVPVDGDEHLMSHGWLAGEDRRFGAGLVGLLTCAWRIGFMKVTTGLRTLGVACAVAFFWLGGCGSSGNSSGDLDGSVTGADLDGASTVTGGGCMS